MARRRTVKEVDSDLKGLRQELLRLKDEVAELKQVVARHITVHLGDDDEEVEE